jgi:hypothetical protein
MFSKLDYAVRRTLLAAPLGTHVIRYLRPKLPAGFRRVEWRCSCGVLLYNDYCAISRASAQALDSLECRLHANTETATSKTSNMSSITSVRGEERSKSSSSRTTLSSVDFSDQLPSTTKSPARSSSQRRKDDSSAANGQMFLELCVNTEPRRTVLEEIPIKTRGGISHIDNDFDLWRKSSSLNASCPFTETQQERYGASITPSGIKPSTAGCVCQSISTSSNLLGPTWNPTHCTSTFTRNQGPYHPKRKWKMVRTA